MTTSSRPQSWHQTLGLWLWLWRPASSTFNFFGILRRLTTVYKCSTGRIRFPPVSTHVVFCHGDGIMSDSWVIIMLVILVNPFLLLTQQMAGWRSCILDLLQLLSLEIISSLREIVSVKLCKWQQEQEHQDLKYCKISITIIRKITIHWHETVEGGVL